MILYTLLHADKMVQLYPAWYCISYKPSRCYYERIDMDLQSLYWLQDQSKSICDDYLCYLGCEIEASIQKNQLMELCCHYLASFIIFCVFVLGGVNGIFNLNFLSVRGLSTADIEFQNSVYLTWVSNIVGLSKFSRIVRRVLLG